MRNPKFPTAHLWLLIPLVILLSGFYYTYWSKFTEVPFRQHVHAFTATTWSILLVLQPWFYNNRPISYHRKIGFIGLFLAGGVVFTAFQLLPFNGTAYGFTFHNLIALIGFSTAVVLAMFNSREYKKHARWMISSVFWILQPAAGRLLYFVPMALNNGVSPFNRLSVWYFSVSLTLIPLLIIIYLDYRKEKVVYRSYLFAFTGAAISTSLFPFMQKAEWWISFCKTVMGQGL
jgi:hypothetical protein